MKPILHPWQNNKHLTRQHQQGMSNRDGEEQCGIRSPHLISGNTMYDSTFTSLAQDLLLADR